VEAEAQALILVAEGAESQLAAIWVLKLRVLAELVKVEFASFAEVAR
jgi:hypothetical protein